MIFETFEKLTNDRMVKALIGMGRQKFDDLVPVFASAENRIQQERLRKKEIKRLPSGGHQGVLNTPKRRLFFVLYYLKTYPTFDVLGFHFGLSAGHAHDFIATYLTVLEGALKTLTVFPHRHFKDVADFMQAVETYDEVMIDGVEMPCVRPRDPDQQKDRYSGKKKRHTVKALILSNSMKQVLYLSPLSGGHHHDYALFKACFDPQLAWFFTVTLRADLGFYGADKDYGRLSDIRLPHKKPRKSKNNPAPELTPGQKQANRDQAAIRVVVEHAIAGLKHFYCLTHRIRNHSLTLIDRFFGVCAGLWNLKIA
jgi:hypothetical protein